MSLTLFALRHLLMLALVAATAWAAGRLVSRALRRGGTLDDADGAADGAAESAPDGVPDRTADSVPAGEADGVAAVPGRIPNRDGVPWPLTFALGFAAIAQGLLLLGLAGWLRAPVLIPLAAGLLLAAAFDWQGDRPAMASPDPDPRASLPRRVRGSAPSRARVLGWSVAIAAMALPPFVLTLYPPLGFDQTMYHLPFARAFAESGGVPVLPALRYPVFPALVELWQAAVLLVAGDAATQVVGWIAFAACTGLVFVWARELSSPAGGWIAAAIYGGSPIALYLAATGYVEPPLGLLGLAALYAAAHARPRARVSASAATSPGDEGGTPSGAVVVAVAVSSKHGADAAVRTPWIVAAGFLAGSAASVKYLGLYFVLAAAVLLVAGGRTPWRRRRPIRDLLVYGIAACVALAPSYGRVLFHTGNPVFPFYPELFGTSAWTDPVFMGARGTAFVVSASTLLWDVTFRRDLVGGLPFFSPALALGVPLALIAAWRRSALRLPLLIAVTYVFLAPPHAHYLLAIAPLFSVAIGTAASALIARGPGGRPLLVGTAMLLALGGEAYALFSVHRLGPPPATVAGRDALLEARLPLYPAIGFLNRATRMARGAGPVLVYAIDAERMVYYADFTLLGDVNGPTSYDRIAARVREGRSLSDVLANLGASYLLVPANRPFWTAEAITDPWLERAYVDAHAVVYRVLPIGRPGGTPAREGPREPSTPRHAHARNRSRASRARAGE